MILFQQIRKLLLITITLFFVISTVTAFGAMDDSYAAQLGNSSINPPTNQIAWGWGKRSEALAKDIEGKAQEALGNITGDPKDQLMGNAKQVESRAMNKKEDMKDSMKLKGRSKAVTKNHEGKAQEAVGNTTRDPKDKLMGNVKQVESQVRNAIQDIKGN